MRATEPDLAPMSVPASLPPLLGWSDSAYRSGIAELSSARIPTRDLLVDELRL
jgi:hypothetical protein